MATQVSQADGPRARFGLGRKKRTLLADIGAWIILAVGGILMLAPFLWMVSSSLKTIEEIYRFPPVIIPEVIQWNNYIEAWTTLPFGRFFWNSAVISASVVFGQLLTCSLAGYAFGRLRFPFRDKIFLAYLSTMMIPFAVIMIPLYIQMQKFGWIDTFWPLIIPAIFTPWGTFLMRQFMSTLPRDLEDAGRIDGCNFLRVYWSIILPLTKPALATLGIFTFLGTWNSFLWPLIIISSLDNKTVPLGMVAFQARQAMKTPWELIMAAATFAVIPVLIAFVVGQKYYVQGIVTSGIKGGG